MTGRHRLAASPGDDTTGDGPEGNRLAKPEGTTTSGRDATPPNQPDTINGVPVSTTATVWPKR